MAHLNVRERRLEAKIAFVGPQLSGKATNFARLGGRAIAADDVLALDWTPGGATAFRDYEVTVRLVAPRGAPSEASVRDVLEEADGIIFVADADPAAHERNRASLDVVRDVLASAPPRNIPVVVQVNKTDLPDALTADEVVRALDAGTWPHVSACATNGDGVVETVERALATVLEVLRAGGAEGGESGAASESVAPITARPEGNPLLSALRQVLRDTVSEHVVQIEARTNANMERLLAAFFERIESSAGKNDSAAKAAQDAAAFQLSIVEDNARLRELVESLRVRTDDLVRDQAAALAAVEATAAATPAAIERLREDIKGDLVRLLESRARTEREHLASSTAQIRRSLESVTAEVKLLDSRSAISAIRTTLDAITKMLEPTAAAVRTFEPKIVHAESVLLKEVRDGLARATKRLEDGITGHHGDTAEALQKTDAIATETHKLLAEVVEELKKPKKGWFS